jgi:hypothetical protein
LDQNNEDKVTTWVAAGGAPPAKVLGRLHHGGWAPRQKRCNPIPGFLVVYFFAWQHGYHVRDFDFAAFFREFQENENIK